MNSTPNVVKRWIQYDIDKIKDLRNGYQATADLLFAELPAVNWDSRIEVKDYFKQFGIELFTLQLEELNCHKDLLEVDDGTFNPEPHEVLSTLIEFYRVRYVIRNYLDCIIFHENHGIVSLRAIPAEWVLPNKRPVPTNEDIASCELMRG